VLAAIGTTAAEFQPEHIAVAFNGVAMCRAGAALDHVPVVDLSPIEVLIDIDLGAGTHEATLWTNDLTAQYVHENSAYST
jgi:glutamate N-acetyltransferase/amino-acid N-acetyltransferase